MYVAPQGISIFLFGVSHLPPPTNGIGAEGPMHEFLCVHSTPHSVVPLSGLTHYLSLVSCTGASGYTWTV